MDTCGIPNKANWLTRVVYTDDVGDVVTLIYTCDEHFPGNPGGSMSEDDVRSILRIEGSETVGIYEYDSRRLR